MASLHGQDPFFSTTFGSDRVYPRTWRWWVQLSISSVEDRGVRHFNATVMSKNGLGRSISPSGMAEVDQEGR